MPIHYAENEPRPDENPPQISQYIIVNDGGGGSSTTASQSSAPQQKPGDQAFAVAQRQLGKAYVYNTSGPDTFDCSGLMQYSYLNGPHIDPGRDTNAQWNNNTTFKTVWDAVTQSGPIAAADLQVGDLILYFVPGNSGENAHVKMYAGGGQTIEAPYTGAVVKMATLDLVGSSTEPFRGIKRPSGGGSSGGPGGSAGGGGSGGSGDTSQGSGQQGGPPVGKLIDPKSDEAKNLAIAPLDDPRNNLPFSALFMGANAAETLGGGFRVFMGPKAGAVNVSSTLVRGGMVELLANVGDSSSTDPTSVKLQARKGGQFACYFMMNPSTISTDCAMNVDVAAPSQVDPTAMQQGAYWVQNQTIAFTLIFNRMYEVWQGNVKGPNGKPGPSDIGCRWDIRSIERLMGIYDAKADYPGTQKPQKISGQTGLGTYGAGDRPPQGLGLQVVFGGPNSIQFQGMIASMDYTYTMFDHNMVPVEASVDLTVMRMYLPNLSSADIVNPLVSQMGQAGNLTFPFAKGSVFNNGVVKTKGTAGGIAKAGIWL
jgi:cell wall-associated NlpC family hydrolase